MPRQTSLLIGIRLVRRWSLPGFSGDFAGRSASDIGLPGNSEIEGIRCQFKCPSDLVLCVDRCVYDDAPSFAALCAGASGYLCEEYSRISLISLHSSTSGRRRSPMSPLNRIPGDLRCPGRSGRLRSKALTSRHMKFPGFKYFG